MNKSEERRFIIKTFFYSLIILSAGLFWAYSNTRHNALADIPPMEFYLNKAQAILNFVIEKISIAQTLP